MANGGPDQLVSVNEEVEFSADASEDRDNDALSYLWDFGDGSTSTELFASHTYKKSGLFVTTLTVSDGYEESTARITVYVEKREETPGFGGLGAFVGLLGAAMLAVGAARARKR